MYTKGVLRAIGTYILGGGAGHAPPEKSLNSSIKWYNFLHSLEV